MMTTNEATEWVYDQDEQGEVDQDELREAFVALYGREPDADETRDMWSHCCNATPNCGTRPTSQRDELIAAIEAADLTSPEQVADFVLTALDEQGYEAAKAELAKAIRNDATA